MTTPVQTPAKRTSTSALAKLTVQAVDIDPAVLESAFESVAAIKFPDDHPAVVLLRESIADAPERIDPRTGRAMSRIGAARALAVADGEDPADVVTLVERVSQSIGLGKPMTQVKHTPKGVLVVFKARTKIVGTGRRNRTANNTDEKPVADKATRSPRARR